MTGPQMTRVDRRRAVGLAVIGLALVPFMVAAARGCDSRWVLWFGGVVSLLSALGVVALDWWSVSHYVQGRSERQAAKWLKWIVPIAFILGVALAARDSSPVQYVGTLALGGGLSGGVISTLLRPRWAAALGGA